MQVLTSGALNLSLSLPVLPSCFWMVAWSTHTYTNNECISLIFGHIYGCKRSLGEFIKLQVFSIIHELAVKRNGCVINVDRSKTLSKITNNITKVLFLGIAFFFQRKEAFFSFAFFASNLLSVNIKTKKNIKFRRPG